MGKKFLGVIFAICIHSAILNKHDNFGKHSQQEDALF